MMMTAIRKVLMVFICVSMFAGCLPAADSAESSAGVVAGESVNPEVSFRSRPQEFPESESSEGSFQFPLYRTVGGLGLVLCLMLGLYFGARKYFPQYFQKADLEKNLKILETLSMGDRRSIALIQVADKRYLVGNTSNQINLLTTLSEPIPQEDEVAAPEALSGDTAKKESGNSFRNLFEFEKKRPVPNTGNPFPEDIRTKMRLLREALER